MVYKLVDVNTGEVIRQVPPEEMLQVSRAITERFDAQAAAAAAKLQNVSGK
jgi:uncharacterized FlaG/YvyC family protein